MKFDVKCWVIEFVIVECAEEVNGGGLEREHRERYELKCV